MEKLADIPKLANLGFVNPSSPPPPQSDDSKSTETTDVASPSAPVASKDADRTESLTPIPSPPTLSEMAINCEWGAFDSFTHEHLPRTKYDKIVDETSNKPGEQAFEVIQLSSNSPHHSSFTHLLFIETDLRTLPRRNPPTRHRRPHRHRLDLPRPKHLQTRNSLFLRHRFPLPNGIRPNRRTVNDHRHFHAFLRDRDDAC